MAYESFDKKIINKSEEEDYEFNKKNVDYKKLLKEYSIPIVCIILLAVILYTAILPVIRNTFNNLDQINELRAKEEELDRRLSRLGQLERDALRTQTILDRINELVPTEKSEVVSFRDRVIGTAQNQGLQVEAVKAGESIINTDPTVVTTLENLSLIEIPSSFNVRGEFGGLRRFLNDLYAGTDFFIVSEMDVNAGSITANEANWFGKFDIIKYQFFVPEGFSVEESFAKVSEYEEPDGNIIEFIEENFIVGPDGVNPLVTPTPQFSL